jgi:serine/threonine protein kinase
VAGRVFKSVELVRAKEQALKKSFHARDHSTGHIDKLGIEIANEYAENEHTVLTALNPNGCIEGLLPPPSKVFYIPSSKVDHLQLALFAMELKASDMTGAVQESFNQLVMEDKLTVVRQLLAGLAHMHQNGYVHRDLKPENCLVDVADDGRVCNLSLGDYGIAKKSQLPEDYRWDATKITRTILWILLGGEGLIQREWHQWNNTVTKNALAALDVSNDLKKVLRKGLESKFGNAAELLHAFDVAKQNG